MVAGRRPKPTQLKIVQATYRPDRGAGKAESLPQRFEVGDPPPKWLRGAHQIRAWRELTATLGTIEVATVGDLHSIGFLCDAFGRFLKAKGIVDREGQVYEQLNETTGVRMIRAHPAYAQMSEAWNQTVKLMIEFGMTPASRSRVSKVEKGDVDPFADWESGSPAAADEA